MTKPLGLVEMTFGAEFDDSRNCWTEGYSIGATYNRNEHPGNVFTRIPSVIFPGKIFPRLELLLLQGAYRGHSHGCSWIPPKSRGSPMAEWCRTGVDHA